LKLRPRRTRRNTLPSSSIHPQGWVPIETRVEYALETEACRPVAFTPKGGCPLKP